jgi:hypothetical protein
MTMKYNLTQQDLAQLNLTPGPSPSGEGGKSFAQRPELFDRENPQVQGTLVLRTKVVSCLKYFVNHLPKCWFEASKSPVSGDSRGIVGRILCTAVFIAFLFLAPTQAQDPKDLAKEIMDSYASHKEPVEALRKLNEADADKVVDALMSYVASPEAEVRRTALNMIQRLTSRRSNADLQKQMISLLIRMLDDNESSIASQAAGYLTQYPPKVFDSESRYLLTQSRYAYRLSRHHRAYIQLPANA